MMEVGLAGGLAPCGYGGDLVQGERGRNYALRFLRCVLLHVLFAHVWCLRGALTCEPERSLR